MNVGVILEGIALILFAMMYYTDDHALILTLAVIARLIGGFVFKFHIHKRQHLCFSLHFMPTYSNYFLKRLKR